MKQNQANVVCTLALLDQGTRKQNKKKNQEFLTWNLEVHLNNNGTLGESGINNEFKPIFVTKRGGETIQSEYKSIGEACIYL